MRDILITDELYRKTFGQLREGYQKAWYNSNAEASELRENIWLTIKLLDQLERTIDRSVQNGKVYTQEELAHEIQNV